MTTGNQRYGAIPQQGSARQDGRDSGVPGYPPSSNAEDFAKPAVDSFARLREDGWDHSVWDSRDAVQVAEDKVHIVVQFSRFTAADKRFATFQSLYVVTQKDGHWGTQARSSLAP